MFYVKTVLNVLYWCVYFKDRIQCTFRHLSRFFSNFHGWTNLIEYCDVQIDLKVIEKCLQIEDLNTACLTYNKFGIHSLNGLLTCKYIYMQTKLTYLCVFHEFIIMLLLFFYLTHKKDTVYVIYQKWLVKEAQYCNIFNYQNLYWRQHFIVDFKLVKSF